MTPEPSLALHTASTACAAVLLLSLIFRLWRLHPSRIRGSPSWQGLFKAAPGILLSVILASYWTTASTLEIQYKTNFLVSLLISLLAALGLSLRLFYEQQQSHKPSHLITLYLLASIICDAVYLTVPSSAAMRTGTSYPVLLRCCVHSVLLILESRARNPASGPTNKHHSPEESHGVLGRVFFTWINPILLRGYRNILVDKDLPPLSRDIKPELTRKAILQAWSQRAKPETERTLPLVLITCLKAHFFAAVIPRLLLIVFRYSQPILIQESIRYAASYPASSGISHGYWLVLSAATIYLGRALSSAIYQHSIDKLKLMTRSALIGLIHDKTMKSPSVAYDNGQAITLMNTDADSLDGLGEMVHETWAQAIEVLIGVILLAREVGWIWPLPLFLIYLCSHMSRYVAKHLQPRQEAWNRATQNRMAATSSVISSMKVVKMLGFEEKLTRRIEELRKEELWIASKQRWVVVYNNASANALGIFSPAITLVLFALLSGARGRDLHTGTAFSTLTILGLITHPANIIMTIVPRAVGALAGLKRIQAFLLQPPLEDNRKPLPRSALDKISCDPTSGRLAPAGPVIQIQQLTIGDKQIILEDINIKMTAGSFTIISGPTGSGKSTLMRAILGEVIPTRGSISLSTQYIAYCSQRPWLPSGTIRQVIYGATKKLDEAWYDEVINACCLAHDFDSLPNGDQTQIGSRGLNLSGGQRQRVALARALFSRCDILLLDDTFSGLDGETEQTIFKNFFGDSGLVWRLKTTVVLISNSSQYFQSANHIVVLGEHGIIDQGSWQDIKVKAASIAKFSSGRPVKENAVLSANFDKLSAQVRAKDETEVDLSRQTGDPALYGYYFRFSGFTNLLILVTCIAIYSFFITIPQYWLQLWTEGDGANSAFYMYGLLFLSFMSWISTSIMMWSVLIGLAPYSGSQLHQHLLQIVTRAPLSYFSQTDNGSILNRFSQDIQIIDKQLPMTFQSVLVQILKLLMQVIVLCMAEKWLAVSLPACAVLVYIVQKVYLRTSRQLRFLELQSQAGVFSNFLESIEGLETIRSFGWFEAVVQNNVKCVDNFQRAGYLFLCLQRWLNIVLDLLSAAVATSVIAIAVSLRGTVSGAQVGIALNIMLLANTTLLKLVDNWTMLETSLGAIARLKSLETSTPAEGQEGRGLQPAKNWPCEGRVEFRDITASYQSDSMALRRVSLSIPAGQKLVVCGRTGSGKSTLLLTLLQLLESKSGKIEVDGIDIREVPLDLLRRRCFVAVSQDPLILPNETLRFNLDPDASVSDHAVVEILIKAGLWTHFRSGKTHLEKETATAMRISGFNELPILDLKMSLLPELSVGQCQLLALCRALIKVTSLRYSGAKPVILLDEVTSSLDSETESIIYRIIDDELTQKGHTVIVVTHRLSALQEYTVVGRDAVALMEDGRLLEVIEDLRPATFQRIGQIE
ncbi:putative ABC transporter [Xylaria sp. FL1777]|nr:putative ABC transporter [Xylaria sp. FL1777]